MSPGAKPQAGRRGRHRFGLTTALAFLVLSTVGTTALLIHLSWSYTAAENVADIARQLNGQIAGAVRQEVQRVVGGAWSLEDAVQSILARDGPAALDRAEREALFVPLLKSQPEVSWVALGSPDGGFFGAQKIDEDEIDLVEIDPPAGGGAARLRISRYRAGADRPTLIDRSERPTDYDPRQEEWYARAMQENAPGWTRLPHLPNSERNAIARTGPLIVGGRPAGVVLVAIEVDRLSRFLSGIAIGRDGAAAIIDPTGYVVASPDPATIRQQRGNETPTLPDLAARSPPIALVAAMIERREVAIEGLAEARQWRAAAPGAAGDSFVTLTPLSFQGWVLATVIPAEDFLAGIDRNSRRLMIGLSVLTVALAAGATLAAHRLVGAPLLRIAAQLKHVERFELEQIRFLPSPLREVDDFSAALVQMAGGLASFRKYIPADLVRTLLAQGVEAMPGGTHRRLTVMFTDIVGFTGLSERLGAEVVSLLRAYLELNTAAVAATGGTIDKFIGDAVMAFWGAPMSKPDHALAACTAALDAQRRLAAGPTGLRMRIGINTGTMLVGNIGSNERLSYTVIGDPVNVASRLEAANKHYGTAILIGEETRADAGAAIRVRRIDRIAVYGRQGGTTVYELLGLADEQLPGWVETYEAGLTAYETRRWDEAIALFEAVIAARCGDRPSAILIDRCREYRQSPPDADWQAVAMLESK